MKRFGKIGWMVGGFAIGVYGTKILGSKTMKKAYSHVAAGALWLKEEVLKDVTAITENCGDIVADAKEMQSKIQKEKEEQALQDARDLIANSTARKSPRTKKKA